jgi:hypothetical protein
MEGELTERPRPVCVLGVGRSGTSLVARTLNLLGVDLGREDTMLAASEVNPKGYWEQREAVELNGEILAALGGDWWCPPARPAGWELGDDMAVFRDRISDLVDRYFAGSGRWGFKDPRTTLTLPLWRSVVGEFDYVVCMRNPLEVVASAEGVSEAFDPVALWLYYGCEALRLTAGRRRIFVFYEEWLDGADRVTRRLGQFLHGPDWTPGEDARGRAAAEWDPSLRRRRATDLELAERVDVPVEARTLHFVSRALAEAERMGDERARALQAFAAALDEDAVVRSQPR